MSENKASEEDLDEEFDPEDEPQERRVIIGFDYGLDQLRQVGMSYRDFI